MLDASVALAWSFEDEHDDYADRILSRLTSGGASAVAPPVWPSEVVNGLLVAERRGRHTAAQTTQLVADLSQLPVDVESTRISVTGAPVLAVARMQKLSVYDASYLELALRLGLPLATVDGRLRAAAGEMGVALAA